MNPNIISSKADFAKLAQDQRNKLIQLKKQAKESSNTNTSSLSTITYPASTIQPLTTRVNVYLAPGAKGRQLLSNHP
jgi:hypothetical protein